MCIDGSYLVQKGSVDVGGCGDVCSQVDLDVAELLVMSEGFFCSVAELSASWRTLSL